MALERLEHSKIYPFIRKALVGLIIALICVIGFAISTSAVDFSVVSTEAKVNQKVSGYAEIGVDTIIATDITIDLVLQIVNDTNPSYQLVYTTLPTSVVVFGDFADEPWTIYHYFDSTFTEGDSCIFHITNYHNEDSNGAITQAGIRVSVRSSRINPLEFENKRTFSTNLRSIERITGNDIPCTLTINVTILPSSENASYAEGYAQGVNNTIISGLSAEQNAFGIISSIINSTTNFIQQFVMGIYRNPIGAIILTILGIGLGITAITWVVKFFV